MLLRDELMNVGVCVGHGGVLDEISRLFHKRIKSLPKSFISTSVVLWQWEYPWWHFDNY